MNNSVNFETAKILKAKGFNLKVIHFYNYERLSCLSDKDRQLNDGLVNYNPINWNSTKEHYTSAPSIAEVIMWLYEKHNIWISVTYQRHSEGKHWRYTIKRIYGTETVLWEHNTPEEAYEAAIEYTLKNLI